MDNDIRWHQRFSNYNRALVQLQKFIDKKVLNELEAQGLVQAFEFTHELAWNTLKDYFEYQGNIDITGSRDATREAFQKGLIVNGEVWMEMIQSRNLTSHSYNEHIIAEIKEKILNLYFKEFIDLKTKMNNYL